MNGVLDAINDWCERAQAAGYDVNELARGLGISVRHLERVFGDRFNLTPQDWLNVQRLCRALPLLKGTTQSIKEIADKLGFEQASHFSRCFKAEYGKAPSQVRALLSRPGKSLKVTKRGASKRR